MYHLFKFVNDEWEYVGPALSWEYAVTICRIANSNGHEYAWLAF